MFLAARNKINPTHRITDAARKCVATENESPIPVQTATYAARHSGHFGSSARIAPGMIQLAISRPVSQTRHGPTSVVAGSRLDLAALACVHTCTSVDPQPQVADAGDAVSGQ